MSEREEPPALTPALETSESVNRFARTGLKVRLFRSMFRGRQDVYPLRWESAKGDRAGYVFACANDWVPGICRKKEVPKPKKPCQQCAHRQYLPVTDEVVRQHFRGRDAGDKPFVAGVYPLLPDDTCWFLAIDFDEASWEQDCKACLETCRSLGLAAGLERSRSGKGGHIWLFFEEALPASWRDAWAATSSLRPWSGSPRSASPPMTGSFPARTPCRRASWAI